MTEHDEEFPVGLETGAGTRRSPGPSSDKGRVSSIVEEPVVAPARTSFLPRNGPPPAADARSEVPAAGGLAFLDSGPNFTVIPELAPTIPKMGWGKWQYKLFWKPIGKEDHWPALNRKNQLDYEIGYLEERLRQLANVTQITIGVHNSIGGSGKSTTAIYLASIIYTVTHAFTFAMSATSNLQTTALARYAGVESADTGERQAQRVHELASLSKKEINFRTVSNMVRISNHGVRVVAEDQPRTLQKSDGFKAAQFERVAEALFGNSNCIIFDCGNDNVEPSSIPLEAARRADVMVFPANTENPASLEKVARELSIYSSDESDGFVPYTPGKHRTGREIPTIEKAERAVVVFTNTSPNQKAEAFTEYLPAGFKGVALVVPKDRYIRPADITKFRAANPADPSKIDKYTTYHAFSEVAVAAFEMAARLQGIELPDPPFVAE